MSFLDDMHMACLCMHAHLVHEHFAIVPSLLRWYLWVPELLGLLLEWHIMYAAHVTKTRGVSGLCVLCRDESVLCESGPQDSAQTN